LALLGAALLRAALLRLPPRLSLLRLAEFGL
jgi:hypothetical protein